MNASLCASLATRLLAAEESGSLITKVIPSTGERLPVIGLGTNQFDESIALALREVLARFVELGGRVVDTAAVYGSSESVIGKLLAEARLRNKVFLATKFTGPDGLGMPGPPVGGRSALSEEAMQAQRQRLQELLRNQVFGEESFKRSLQRLQTDHVDLLYVHNMSGTEALLPQMQEWRRTGKLRYIGISTSNKIQHGKMVNEMQKFPVDFVEVNYSIAGRDAEATVLAEALARKIAVVVNVPLGGPGGISLASVAGKQLPPFAAEIGVTSWAQYMLKFVASHPAVTCVISGSTKFSHLEDNQRAARGVLPDAAMRRRMQEYWDSVV